jgi:hypothetical protein
MTQEEALVAARRHVAECNAEMPASTPYLLAIGQPDEYRDFWYFDYTITAPPNRPAAKTELLVGGAPGFVVAKHNGEIHPLSWSQKAGLREQEALLLDFEQRASRLAQEPQTLQRLRHHFRLPLPALQAFKRELETTPAPAQKARLLQKHLMQQANFFPLVTPDA